MIDAPLDRTPTHAKSARLNTMAAGEIETFETVKPVLDVRGDFFFDLGALDAGHTTKLINNVMGMTSACTMSQVFAVVQKRPLMANSCLILCQRVREFSLHVVLQKPCPGWSEQSWLYIHNGSTDVHYFLQMSEDLGTSSEIAICTFASMQAAIDVGLGNGNVPKIFDMFAKQGSK